MQTETEQVELLREFAKEQEKAETLLSALNRELDGLSIQDDNVTPEALQKLREFTAKLEGGEKDDDAEKAFYKRANAAWAEGCRQERRNEELRQEAKKRDLALPELPWGEIY